SRDLADRWLADRASASLRACIASGVVKPRVATIFSNAVRTTLGAALIFSGRPGSNGHSAPERPRSAFAAAGDYVDADGRGRDLRRGCGSSNVLRGCKVHRMPVRRSKICQPPGPATRHAGQWTVAELSRPQSRPDLHWGEWSAPRTSRTQSASSCHREVRPAPLGFLLSFRSRTK